MNLCRHAATVVGAAAMLLIITGYASAAAAATPTPPSAQSPAPNAALIQRAWWNQAEPVDALKLTDAQRTKMNDLLTRSVESQRAAQPQQGQHQKAFEQALANGDWASARKEATGLRDGMAATWAAQTALKIDVLSVLTAEQRQLVVARYPLLLRQPSVFGLPKGPPPRPAVATPHS